MVVLTKALFRVADRLALSGTELAEILTVSPATVSRLKGTERALALGSAEMQLAALLVRVYRSLDSLLNDDEKARAWLVAENSHIGGKPLELIKTIRGLVAVSDYLDALRGKL